MAFLVFLMGKIMLSDKQEYILLVGGAGYIGSHTNKILFQKGFETIVLDNLCTGHKEFVKWGKFEFGDIQDKLKMNKIFTQYKIKAVIHFAGFAYIGESVDSPAKYYTNNVANTIHLLNAMLENDVKFLIFSSSSATFGNPEYLPLDEKHPQNPISPYGTTKLIVEKMLYDYDKSYGLKSVILRYFNAAGADPECEIGEFHDPETHLIPLLLQVAMGKKERFPILGNDYSTTDGTCIRDYIHVNDLAEAHVLSLEWLINNNRSDHFNLGSNQGFSVKEIIKIVESVTGSKIACDVLNRRKGDPSILVSSTEKIQKILRWKPKFKIEDMIKTAWNWNHKIIDYQ